MNERTRQFGYKKYETGRSSSKPFFVFFSVYIISSTSITWYVSLSVTVTVTVRVIWLRLGHNFVWWMAFSVWQSTTANIIRSTKNLGVIYPRSNNRQPISVHFDQKEMILTDIKRLPIIHHEPPPNVSFATWRVECAVAWCLDFRSAWPHILTGPGIYRILWHSSFFDGDKPP